MDTVSGITSLLTQAPLNEEGRLLPNDKHGLYPAQHFSPSPKLAQFLLYFGAFANFMANMHQYKAITR